MHFIANNKQRPTAAAAAINAYASECCMSVCVLSMYGWEQMA